MEKKNIMIEDGDMHYFTTSVMSLITGFSLFKLIKSQWNLTQNRRMIKKIQTTKIKSVDDDLKDKEFVILKGSVAFHEGRSENQIIKREVSKGKFDYFLVHIRYMEGIYSNDGFTNKEDYRINLPEIIGKSQIDFNPSFLIAGDRKSVVVNQWDHLNYQPILEIFKWNTKKKRLNLTEKMQTLIFTYFRSIGNLVISDKSRPNFMRGLEVGTREVETGVKMGSSIMALGTIGVTVDGTMFLEPHIFFKDRISIITNLKELISEDEFSRNIWGLVFILGAIYVGRRAFHYNKKHGIWQKIKQKFQQLKAKA